MSNNEIANEEIKPKVNPWLMALPLMAGAFMFQIDETIANVALPHMAGSFSASREESLWIITSYLIASGIIIPAVGFFSKIFGRKNFFMISVLIFTVASFLCGISTSLDMMVLSRILQGIGGGALMPIAQAIILESFSAEERGKAMATFGLVVVIAPIIGPVLGGWVTDNWSWPFIYLINIPIGFMALFLAKMFIVDPPYAKKQKNVYIDKMGFFTLTGWLVSLQVILDKGNNADWFNSSWVCWLTLICVIFGGLFLRSQIKNKESLVDLSVFKDKNFFFGTIMQIVMQGVLLSSLAVLPQFLQYMLGYDAFLSGMAMMPRGVGALLGVIIYGSMANKMDNRILVAVGLALIAVGGWVLGFVSLQIAPVNIEIPNLLYGVGMALAMMPIIALSCCTLKNEQMTNASGLQNLLKNVGGAFGTSIAATLISRMGQIHQNMLVGNLHPLNPQYMERLKAMTAAFSQHTDLTTATAMAEASIHNLLLQQANLMAFIDAFRVFSIACLVIIPLILFIKNKKRSGNEPEIMMH